MSTIDIDTMTEDELLAAAKQLEILRAKRAQPKTPAEPLNKPPPAPPPPTDAEKAAKLEDRVKVLEGLGQGLRTELHKEFEQLVDQIRSEVYRMRQIARGLEEPAARPPFTGGVVPAGPLHVAEGCTVIQPYKCGRCGGDLVPDQGQLVHTNPASTCTDFSPPRPKNGAA